MPASSGAAGMGGAGDEDIDPATGLPRVTPPQPGVFDRLRATLPAVLQSPITQAVFPAVGGLATATQVMDKANLLGGPPPAQEQPSAVDQALGIADATPAQPQQPVTVPTPKPAGTGGGGGIKLPLGPSAGETVARGGVQTAREGEQGVYEQRGGTLEQHKQDDAALEIVHRERERQLQEATDARTAQLNADLKAKQDVLAKDKIHDMFDGRPLAAVLAAISSGLGAFAASRTGGPNHAQAILDNAAQLFRQKELHRIEGEEKAVEGAKGDIKYADTRADAAVAQLYRTFAREREAMLRAHGWDDEQINNDLLIKQNATKGAEQDLKWQERNSELARQEVNDRAQRAVQGATAAHLGAETGKLRAETAALAAGGGKEPGKGITDARQRAFLSNGLIHEEERAKRLEAAGVGLDEKDLARIQDNRTFLAAQREGHGDAEALKTVLMRKWGLVPRNEFDGLDDQKKELAGALNLMTQKAALLNAGSMTKEGIQHSSDIVDLLAPNVGDKERARRRDYIRTGVIGSNQGLVPSSMAAARAGSDAAAAREAAAPAPAAARPTMTPAQRVQATEFVRANPNDPRAKAIREALLAQ